MSLVKRRNNLTDDEKRELIKELESYISFFNSYPLNVIFDNLCIILRFSEASQYNLGSCGCAIHDLKCYSVSKNPILKIIGLRIREMIDILETNNVNCIQYIYFRMGITEEHINKIIDYVINREKGDNTV